MLVEVLASVAAREAGRIFRGRIVEWHIHPAQTAPDVVVAEERLERHLALLRVKGVRRVHAIENAVTLNDGVRDFRVQKQFDEMDAFGRASPTDRVDQPVPIG
ncbi:MAG: hypothetical protein NTU83_01655, partial [Candidatus Hydrogenedentes bacterium]|nr:hypothetical protein [Candidatus Hydrogenedentota bacterium]